MSIYESHTFQMVCDGADCYEESSEADTESRAEQHAREDEWANIDGKWYCPKCSEKALRKAKRAAKEAR